MFSIYSWPIYVFLFLQTLDCMKSDKPKNSLGNFKTKNSVVNSQVPKNFLVIKDDSAAKTLDNFLINSDKYTENEVEVSHECTKEIIIAKYNENFSMSLLVANTPHVIKEMEESNVDVMMDSIDAINEEHISAISWIDKETTLIVTEDEKLYSDHSSTPETIHSKLVESAKSKKSVQFIKPPTISEIKTVNLPVYTESTEKESSVETFIFKKKVDNETKDKPLIPPLLAIPMKSQNLQSFIVNENMIKKIKPSRLNQYSQPKANQNQTKQNSEIFNKNMIVKAASILSVNAKSIMNNKEENSANLKLKSMDRNYHNLKHKMDNINKWKTTQKEQNDHDVKFKEMNIPKLKNEKTEINNIEQNEMSKINIMNYIKLQLGKKIVESEKAQIVKRSKLINYEKFKRINTMLGVYLNKSIDLTESVDKMKLSTLNLELINPFFVNPIVESDVDPKHTRMNKIPKKNKCENLNQNKYKNKKILNIQFPANNQTSKNMINLDYMKNLKPKLNINKEAKSSIRQISIKKTDSEPLQLYNIETLSQMQVLVLKNFMRLKKLMNNYKNINLDNKRDLNFSCENWPEREILRRKVINQLHILRSNQSLLRKHTNVYNSIYKIKNNKVHQKCFEPILDQFYLISPSHSDTESIPKGDRSSKSTISNTKSYTLKCSYRYSNRHKSKVSKIC